MGKTVAEKILSEKSGTDARAGDIVVAGVDFAFAHDGTAPLAIRAFESLGASRVFDPGKVALVIDHNSPSPSESVSNLHILMREFAAVQGVKVYDVGEGICHQLVPERGHVVPGDLAIGADSHTCSYGAINVFATGVGSTDLAVALATGKIWLRVPETVRIELKGFLPHGVFSKDIILWLIGRSGAEGMNYKAVEFDGELLGRLTIDARFTIANMVVEMGAKAGLMPADIKVMEWVAGRSNRRPRPVAADGDARYAGREVLDAESLGPQVARPHRVDDVVGVNEVAGTHIDQAVIGTCTNGRLEDLRAAAVVLTDRRVNPRVRLIIVPASVAILEQAIREGIAECLMGAGAVLVNPGCGPCVGTHQGIPGSGETVISTANRNFVGRMGNERAFIYLASPATVAASAVAGEIVDPCEFLPEEVET